MRTTLTDTIQQLNQDLGEDPWQPNIERPYRFGIAGGFYHLAATHYRTADDESSTGSTRIIIPKADFTKIIEELTGTRKASIQTKGVTHYQSEHYWCGEFDMINDYSFDHVKGLFVYESGLLVSQVERTRIEKLKERPTAEEVRELLGA